MEKENECGNGSCEMKTRIENLEKDSERNQVTHKEFFGRFENIKEQLARNDEKYLQIIRDTSEIKSDLRETKTAIQQLNEKPAKRWDSIVDKAIWAVCAAVIAFLLARVGLT